MAGKRSYIPPEYRPKVPGGCLERPLKSERIERNRRQEVLLLSAKQDLISRSFLHLIEEAAEQVLHLFYEDLGEGWSFSYREGDLQISLSGKLFRPKAIYHRHPGVERDHPRRELHLGFLQALELWGGRVLGQKSCHYLNSSKPLQLISSMSASLKRERGAGVRIPTTRIVKTADKKRLSFLKEGWIVKSCSNVRSKAAEPKEPAIWKEERINNLPTLFQERIDGVDLRVHLMGDHLWPLEIAGKDCLDYRYASKESLSYRRAEIGKGLKNFCRIFSQTENNPLTGIDFIKRGGCYFCLELNSGPGWSTFPEAERALFAKKLFQELNQ